MNFLDLENRIKLDVSFFRSENQIIRRVFFRSEKQNKLDVSFLEEKKTWVFNVASPTCTHVDNVIFAQLPPDLNSFPPGSEERRQATRLENIVFKKHGSWSLRKINPTSPCMEDGKCTKGFPKSFCEKTIIRSENTYPEYQRLDPAH